MTAESFSAPELLTAEHNIADFESGEDSLDSWLRKKALRNQASGASRTFVITFQEKVVGFYCLAAGAIAQDSAPKKLRRNMPNPLPVLVLGRLAIDKQFQNKGLGCALLRDALLRAVHVAKDAGIFAILVHALSEQAKRFYLSRGFVESPIQSMTLMTLLTQGQGYQVSNVC